VVGHLGTAHGAEIDGIELPERLQAALGNIATRAQVALGAPVQGLDLESKIPGAAGEFAQHLESRVNYLRADAVTP
jgi:hypothetical protein